MIEEGKCVEKEIEEYEGKIKDKRRRNKEITEKIIKQKGEIEGLTHRKTYV